MHRITKPELTNADEARILHVWDTHVGDPTSAQPLTDADKIAFARALLQPGDIRARVDSVRITDLSALLDQARYNLLGASNYVDVLGGVSQSYRQFVARIDAALGL